MPRLVGTHDTGRVTAPLPPLSEIERSVGTVPGDKDQRARALDAIRRAAIEAAGSDDLLGDEVAARIRARLSDEAIAISFRAGNGVFLDRQKTLAVVSI